MKIEVHLAILRACVLDEAGHVYLNTGIGFGLVHTQDVGLAAEAVESGLWEPVEMHLEDLPRHFGYVKSPSLKPLDAMLKRANY